ERARAARAVDVDRAEVDEAADARPGGHACEGAGPFDVRPALLLELDRRRMGDVELGGEVEDQRRRAERRFERGFVAQVAAEALHARGQEGRAGGPAAEDPDAVARGGKDADQAGADDAGGARHEGAGRGAHFFTDERICRAALAAENSLS